MAGYVGIDTALYTPVSYIQSQSDGKQYIDTGLKAHPTTRVLLDIQLVYQYTNKGIFGTPNSDSTFNFSLYQNNGQDYYVRYGSLDKYIRTRTTMRITIDLNGVTKKCILTSDDTRTVDLSTATTSPDSTDNMYIFAGNKGLGSAGAYFKLYSCKIYESGTLVRDFVPAVDDSNVAGVFDLVENKFYYNGGTGSFTAGTTSEPVTEEVARKIKKVYVGLPRSYTPIEYIESTGTEYIDTGYVPKANTRFVLDCNVQENTHRSYEALFGCRTTNYQTQAYCFFSRFSKNSSYYPCFNRSGAETTGSNMLFNQRITLTTLGQTATWTNGIETYSITTTGTANDCAYSLFLFNLSSSGNPDTSYCLMKLYSFKAYEGDTLVREYIPVLDENDVPCLYETVEGKFYYNAGEKQFLYSYFNTDEYDVLDYVTSDGSQKINSGLKVSYDSRISAKYTVSGVNGERLFSVSDNLKMTFGIGAQLKFAYSYNNSSYSWNDINSPMPYSNTLYYIDWVGINKKVFINGSSISLNGNASVTSNDNMIMLDGIHGKIYQVDVYQNGDNQLSGRFIPVKRKSDDEICFYDLVSKQFFTNQGTGTYTAGNVVGTTKQAPVPIGGRARKIIKGYVGVNGVARLCFGSSANYTMLYDYGDEGESGGFFYTRFLDSSTNKDHDFSSHSYSINADNIYVYGSQTSTSYDSFGGMLSNNEFNMSDYTKIYAKTAYQSMGNGTNIYTSTFAGSTYNLGSGGTRNFSFSKNGSGTITTNKPNNVFSISKTDTRKIGLGVSSNGWGGSVGAYLYVLTMFKADNVSALATYLSVNPTIADILAVSSQLLNDENAINIMLTYTGDFMISALADSTFMTQLNSSPYKNTVLNNPHWNKFYGFMTT